ncbi:hypothetical protein GE061_003287 [Apolygus lucorum]|uniref:Cyclic nucleotide-binding domain-containing protein n=1 Tax=Apolygus lucorum TaxID=248454 RepID=A0A8S9X3H2_APOLU|nr:hypothetical protein GE061_003287 [Apolygus lucorum]
MSRKGSDEEQLPTANQSSVRRKTVFAQSYDPKRDSSPTDVFPKSASEIKKIKASLKNVPLLAHLDDATMQQVILAMEHRTVTANQVVIQEGEPGDFFYVIESGVYEASHVVKDKRVVIKTYTDGSFGELALLYDQPRSATVTAKTNGKLWTLSQKNFKKTVAQSDMNRQSKYTELIRKVEILSNLNEDERLKLGDALQSKTYAKGEEIIKQGDQADGMYFIESGHVTINVAGNQDNTLKLKTLKPGDYFGELALLTHQPRAASAVAETDVVVAFLDVGAFERLLGSCDQVMRRNVKTYEKQMKKLFNSPQAPQLRK